MRPKMSVIGFTPTENRESAVANRTQMPPGSARNKGGSHAREGKEDTQPARRQQSMRTHTCIHEDRH